VNPPVQTAVLWQEDPETDQGQVKFDLSNFNLQLGNMLSMDLSSGRALQTAAFYGSAQPVVQAPGQDVDG